jgi:hypothetical protein
LLTMYYEAYKISRTYNGADTTQAMHSQTSRNQSDGTRTPLDERGLSSTSY